ncbi:MAG: HipA N-terminal domain-containing protein [Bacteroidota bacterium]
MINQIKKWMSGGQEDFVTPKDTTVVFNLQYRHLLVGILKIEDGIWSFQYSDDFKKQSKLKPLPDFPNVDKVYESEELYPFFLHRIPSTKQPKVQKEIAAHNIEATNTADLLRLFGTESISNPFRLQVM